MPADRPETPPSSLPAGSQPGTGGRPGSTGPTTAAPVPPTDPPDAAASAGQALPVIEPDWPAPASIRGFVTTRIGGAGRDAHASFNLGLRAGDDPAVVAANRRRLRARLPGDPAWLHQVHGTTVVEAASVAGGVEPRADAAWTDRPGVVCAVLVADCMPVLLCSADGQRVGVAHAGWRGLSGGVVERTIEAMGSPPERTLAWLGPAIGPAAFEVGADVLEAFAGAAPEDAVAFAPIPDRPGKWLADLFELGRRRLRRLGVVQVHGGGLCTHADARRFFSYRRDRVTGRMAAVAWIAP
jgi:YfiH family protein